MFWGIILFIFICLLWLKYLERYLPIWVGAAVGLALFVTVVRGRSMRPGRRG